jgi:hypothetical protein
MHKAGKNAYGLKHAGWNRLFWECQILSQVYSNYRLFMGTAEIAPVQRNANMVIKQTMGLMNSTGERAGRARRRVVLWDAPCLALLSVDADIGCALSSSVALTTAALVSLK